MGLTSEPLAQLTLLKELHRSGLLLNIAPPSNGKAEDPGTLLLVRWPSFDVNSSSTKGKGLTPLSSLRSIV
jgi:hypothetical protein